jgi:RNA polymerase sigma-70 factor (ECF subfamily)
VDELTAAFCSRLPVELRQLVGEGVVELVARARAEVPEVALDPVAFAAYAAERATFDAHGRPRLTTLRAGELWIAFGCVEGNAAAITEFERRFAPEITQALRRTFELALADDAELKLRERLFLVATDDAPRLASYAGRGPLGSWLRAAAMRTAIDLMRARREVAADPEALGALDKAHPLLAPLKQRYREEFRSAFANAAAQLTDRERALLRYRFLDDLSIDEIGLIYQVHRATVARWIAAIRESLFEATRTNLMTTLDISDSEVDSVLRLIDSQLDVSIEAIYGRAASTT